VLPFLAAGVGCLAAFAAVAAVAVLHPIGQELENQALLGAELRSAVEREQSLARLAPISVASFALAILVVMALAGLRRRMGLGVFAAAVMSVSVVAAEVVKELLARPEHIAGPVWLLRNSFPSGTAAVSVAIAVGLLLVSPLRLRWLVVLLGAAFAAVVAHALQVSGWHRLSDVVGSALLVVGVAALATGGLTAAGWAITATTGDVHPRVYLVVVGLGLAAVGVGAVVVALPALFPVLLAPDGSRRAFLQVAFPLAGAGTTALLVALLAWLIQPWSLGRRAAAPGRSTPSPARPRAGGARG
jgi:membrane-associated phospholipid phosphatase